MTTDEMTNVIETLELHVRHLKASAKDNDESMFWLCLKDMDADVATWLDKT